MVLGRPCLALQFFKNGQKRYFWGFQPAFCGKPNVTETPGATLFVQKKFKFAGLYYLFILSLSLSNVSS